MDSMLLRIYIHVNVICSFNLLPTTLLVHFTTRKKGLKAIKIRPKVHTQHIYVAENCQARSTFNVCICMQQSCALASKLGHWIATQQLKQLPPNYSYKLLEALHLDHDSYIPYGNWNPLQYCLISAKFISSSKCSDCLNTYSGNWVSLNAFQNFKKFLVRDCKESRSLIKGLVFVIMTTMFLEKC